MWKNPALFATPVFWRLARRRAFAVVAICLVAACQGMATVAFPLTWYGSVVYFCWPVGNHHHRVNKPLAGTARATRSTLGVTAPQSPQRLE